MAKFPLKRYATLEINRAAYLMNGLVRSQTPLSDEFTDAAPCENGMWVDADIANGEIKLPSADTKQYGIVYTTEKEWGRYEYGMNRHRSVAGEYPRVGLLHSGDIFTTNCFDMGDFDGVEAFEAAMKTLDTTPLYVVPVAGDGRPKVTATKPTSGAYGSVVKYFTVPNGERGIKYTILEA